MKIEYFNRLKTKALLVSSMMLLVAVVTQSCDNSDLEKMNDNPQQVTARIRKK